MVDYFQAQYFRFARMQRKVFANQVRTGNELQDDLFYLIYGQY